MSKLQYLVWHNTGTPKNRPVSSDEIRSWHTDPKPQGNGWSKVGYTDMVHIDGRLENLTPFDQDDEVDGFEITNGARGINSISRHVVLVAGSDKLMNPEDVLSKAQLETMELYTKYMILRHPHILVAGHNQFSSKSCPGFDVPDWCVSVGIPKANIHC